MKQRDNIIWFKGIAFHNHGPEAEICRYTKFQASKAQGRKLIFYPIEKGIAILSVGEKKKDSFWLRYAKANNYF